MSEYELGDIIIFRDHRSSKPVDESGCNQVAVVIDDKRAIFTRECVTVLRLSDVHRLDNAKHISLVFPEVRNEVSSFFRRHMYSRGYVDAGLSALSNRNIMPFLTGDLFPPRPSYSTDAEYEAAWDQMISNMGPFDVLFTTALNSPLSRFIAWYTHGPFSHTAVYNGDGFIGESVTSGTRYVPVTIYKGRQNWVAAFRNVHNKGQVAIAQAKQQLDKPHRTGYNYKRAIWAGTKAFFGNHDGAETPNSMIYQGVYYCIGQA
jgi:hypothetical protein